MSYSLGEAKLILDADAEPLLNTTAKSYSDVQRITTLFVKYMADQNNVRVKDVKAAAQSIIKEEKELNAQLKKEAKAAADDRKKTTQELLKYNQSIAKEEIASFKQLLKERDKAVREQQAAAKKASADALKYEQKALRDAAAERRKIEDEENRRRRADAQAQRNSFGGRLLRGLPGDIATIAGFGAIASGAVLVREALVTVTEATLKQEQAQRSLNAAFGETQLIFKNTSDSLAQSFGRVTSEVEQASAALGVLQNQSNLSGKEINALQQIALDLQAAYGGDLREAFRSAAAAVLGETEALEKYGIVLQEGVLKNSKLLTEEEKRRFTTMSESEKQMIRYRVLVEEAAKVQGAAAARAREAAGGFDQLNRGADELAKTVGGELVKEFGGLAGVIGTAAEALAAFIKQGREFRDLRNQVLQGNDSNWYERNIEANLGYFAPRLPNYLRPSGMGPEQRANIAAERVKEDEEQARRRAEVRQELLDAEKAEKARRDKEEAELKQARERIEAGLKYAHAQELKRIDDQKKAREAELEYALRDVDARKNAELRRIADTENARKAAAELELARIQKEKDVAIKAAEDRKDSDLERIRVSRDATEKAAEDQIRQLEIERDRRKRANEETKTNELSRLETEKEGRDRLREQEDREIAASIKKKERDLEDNHRTELRRLERQGEAARERYNKEIRKIDDKEKREDINEEKANRRHDRRLQQIDDERDAQLKALEKEADERIHLIDAELDKFESAERARDAIRRRRELGQKAADAALELRRATGTQNPADRFAAQQKLIGAIRIGDTQAIEKAQRELTEIVGQGQEAIELAQRNLFDVQEDLRNEDIKQTEDQQKEKLQSEKERIQEQLKLDKERIQEESTRERRQEEERDKRRDDRSKKDKRAAEEAKRAAQDRLNDTLKNIETEQEKEEDKNKRLKRELDDLVEHNKQTLEDRRADEDQAYEDAVEAAQERYRQEQIAIDETYNGEEHGYIPAIRRALKESQDSYEGQTREVENRYKTEREEIARTYDDEVTGLIPAFRRAQRAAEIEYGKLVETTRTKFEEIRQAVQDKYRNPDGKSGIIDQLDNLKKATDDKLREVLDSFEQHAKGLVAPGGVIQVQWETATNQAKNYFDYVQRRTNEMNTKKPNTTSPLIIGPGPNITGGPGVLVPNPDYIPPSGAESAVPPLQDKPTSNVPVKDPNSNYGPFVTAANNGSYWTAEGTHRVEGATDNKGAADVFGPIGTPIYAAVDGTLRPLTDRSGGNAAILTGNNGYYYYLAHGNIPFISGRVQRGQQIGEIGDTGSAKGTPPHLHFAIATDPSIFDRLQGKGNIRGDASYWRTRDKGYLFNNPTMYMDLRTGERGVMAERGPERLLGREVTDKLGKGVLRLEPNYDNVMNMMHAGPTTNNRSTVVNISGIGMDDVVREVKRQLRREELLYGRK